MSRMRTLARTAVNLARFPLAAMHYWRHGQTPPQAHLAMIQLFCATAGRFNDAVSWLIGAASRRLDLPAPVGVLGDLRGQALDQQTRRLREQGYAVFPEALPADVCARLMQFALRSPALVRRMDHEPEGGMPRTALFDPVQPLAVRYDYAVADLLNQADVQALLADPSLLALAQAYLGCRPRADVLSMWWHTPFHQQPDSEAAQYYHFDMDRLKWFKVFIYLTDVGPDDGPHAFIAGSHRSGAIPASMLRKGYVRLSDDEVLGHFGTDRQVVFAAPRGTVIVEDTRGLHKGNAVRGQSRLILQLQFSNSLFGGQYAKSRLTELKDAGLKQQIQAAPDVYANYL